MYIENSRGPRTDMTINRVHFEVLNSGLMCEVLRWSCGV